ncbi:hypothetical protein B0H19DRAFT_1379140 [Mycena capillaripes]|nr:hypothetical protein B0H19DRAFT_1379140 [Mycena capillaripes]
MGKTLSLAESILDDSPKTVMKNLLEISDEMSVQDKAYLLPIFYKRLEPHPFSSKSKDSLSPHQRGGQLGHFGIRGYPILSSLDKLRSQELFPRAALADIWLRMWVCIRIQNDYIDDLAQDGVSVEDGDVWVLHLSLILKFSMCGERSGVITAEHQAPSALSYCAGGTVLDVRSLLLRHLHAAFVDIQSPDGDPRWILQSLAFILETIVHNDSQLIDSLASQGLVKSLINISAAVHDLPDASPAGLPFVQLQIAFVIALAFKLPDFPPSVDPRGPAFKPARISSSLH